MPTKDLNFNTWLKSATHPYAFVLLAKVWEPRKGRMTRESVERRCVEEYHIANVGHAAWDAFIVARGTVVALGTCATANRRPEGFTQ